MKRILSFKYAITGIIHMLRHEPNARIHLIASLVVVFLGVYFRIEKLEWLFITLAIGMVFSAELFNTSLESITDIISPEKNKKAGQAKDTAAGAVLIAAVAAAVIGMVIFLPRIIILVNTSF